MTDARHSSALILGVGSPRGLGASTARAFASAGYRVVIAGRDPEKLDEAARSIAALGATPQVEIGDVTSRQDVARFVARAEAIAPLSLAVHNAGGNRPSPFLQIDPKVFEETQKKLQEELQKRAEEARKKLEANAPAGGAAPANPAPK